MCYSLCHCWGEDKGTRIVACRRLAHRNLDGGASLCYSALTGSPLESYPGLKTLRSERRIGEPRDARVATAKA